jgi:hypothetical protein
MIRRRPKDDRELEQMAGIKPADHGYVSPSVIQQAERKLLGPSWGKKRRRRA